MSTSKKGQLFVKEVVARIKGDDAEALANKIARKALSAVESQIAALNARQVDLENTVEDNQDKLKEAKFPTTMFSENASYIHTIKRAQDQLDASVADLEDVKESLKYFNELLKSF